MGLFGVMHIKSASEEGTHEGIFHTDYPRESAMALKTGQSCIYLSLLPK